MSRYFGWFALGATVIVFALAILFGLGQSVWFDEGYSILLAKRPVGDLIALTAVDAHPPFYYLVLKLVGTMSDWNETAMRGLSALFGAASVGIMALVIKSLFSKKVAIAALPFLILAPFLIRYDYEIRMYALVSLIGVLATYVLIYAWRTQKTWLWIIYGLLVALGMYTLYMSVVIWLGHLVWLVYVTRVGGKPFLKQKWFLAYGGAVVVFLPWLPTVFQQLIHSALPGVMYAVTVQQLLGVLSLLTTYTPDWLIGAWLSVALVVWMGLFGYLLVRVWRKSSAENKQGLLLLALCFIVPLIFYTIISLPPFPAKFISRYVAHISIFAYALAGVVIVLGWKVGRKSSIALAILTLTLLISGMVHLQDTGNFVTERYQRPQNKTVLSGIGGCSDTTMIGSGVFAYIDQWYDFRTCDTRFYDPNNPGFDGGYAPLHDSPLRLTSTTDITSQRIAFVYYEDSELFITVDSRYKLIDKKVYDKTRVDVYKMQ